MRERLQMNPRYEKSPGCMCHLIGLQLAFMTGSALQNVDYVESIIVTVTF